MLVMALCMIASFAAALNIHTLLARFPNHCVIGATLSFNNTCQSTTNGSSTADDGGVNCMETGQQRLDREHEQEFVVWRVKPLAEPNVHIDYNHTVWGDRDVCEYMMFVPVLESICACVWFVLFTICGHGGRSMDS